MCRTRNSLSPGARPSPTSLPYPSSSPPGYPPKQLPCPTTCPLASACSVLSLPRTATRKAAKKRYHKLCLEHHPDKRHVPSSNYHGQTLQFAFTEIVAAYETLCGKFNRDGALICTCVECSNQSLITSRIHDLLSFVSRDFPNMNKASTCTQRRLSDLTRRFAQEANKQDAKEEWRKDRSLKLEALRRKKNKKGVLGHNTKTQRIDWASFPTLTSVQPRLMLPR